MTVERQVAGDNAFAIDAQPGDELLVTAYEDGERTVYFIADRLRTVPLWVLGGRLRRGGWCWSGAGEASGR